MKLGEKIARQPSLHETLRRIINAGEHHVAHKRKNHGVGVQWTQSPKRKPREIKVYLPVIELRSDERADHHAHGAPNHGGEQELADDLVVEFDGYFLVGHGEKLIG